MLFLQGFHTYNREDTNAPLHWPNPPSQQAGNEFPCYDVIIDGHYCDDNLHIHEHDPSFHAFYNTTMHPIVGVITEWSDSVKYVVNMPITKGNDISYFNEIASTHEADKQVAQSPGCHFGRELGNIVTGLLLYTT